MDDQNIGKHMFAMRAQAYIVTISDGPVMLILVMIVQSSREFFFIIYCSANNTKYRHTMFFFRVCPIEQDQVIAVGNHLIF